MVIRSLVLFKPYETGRLFTIDMYKTLGISVYNLVRLCNVCKKLCAVLRNNKGGHCCEEMAAYEIRNINRLDIHTRVYWKTSICADGLLGSLCIDDEIDKVQSVFLHIALDNRAYVMECRKTFVWVKCGGEDKFIVTLYADFYRSGVRYYLNSIW